MEIMDSTAFYDWGAVSDLFSAAGWKNRPVRH